MRPPVPLCWLEHRGGIRTTPRGFFHNPCTMYVAVAYATRFVTFELLRSVESKRTEVSRHKYPGELSTRIQVHGCLVVDTLNQAEQQSPYNHVDGVHVNTAPPVVLW